jgi:excisionase family DNA binding protein
MSESRKLIECSNLAGRIGEQDFFTIKELAEYSKIGSKTLYELVNNRELEFVKIGRKIVIKRTDFEKWFDQNKKKAISKRPVLPDKQKTNAVFSFDD